MAEPCQLSHAVVERWETWLRVAHHCSDLDQANVPTLTTIMPTSLNMLKTCSALQRSRQYTEHQQILIKVIIQHRALKLSIYIDIYWSNHHVLFIGHCMHRFMVGLKYTYTMWTAVVDERQKSQMEKRKKNLKTISPISRGKRKIWIPFPQFREEKSERIFSTFEKRKRDFEYFSLISRGEREYWNSLLFFKSRKRKVK